MNKEVKKILLILEKAGFEAYVVGGFVRDKIIGITSVDIDVCTNALPKDIHVLFPCENINSYGNCNFKIKQFNIDITTYRKELRYAGRKPVEIKYINNLVEDLHRRDFTMNTLCMNKNGKIIDLLDAKKDIKNKVIRSLGDADNKFVEDPLRILRAIRFATTHDFNIDLELEKSIINNVNLVKTLSSERIRSELSKIFHSKNYEKGVNLLKKYKVLEVLNMEINELKYTADILGMWCQVKCDNNLFTKQEEKYIIDINEILKSKIVNEKTIFKYGLYVNFVASEILGYSKSYVNKLYKNMEISDSRVLDINANEICEILNIKPSYIIKEVKEELTNLILERKLKNNNKDLKRYLRNRK